MKKLDYAKKELDLAGIYSESGDGINGWAREAILDLLLTLEKHGTSGSSVGFIVNTFEKLAYGEPLTPLTGEDNEWEDVTEYCDNTRTYQNKRCSSVFKSEDHDKAYDINRRRFVDQDGVSFTAHNKENPERSSMVYIDFPYTPITEYINVTWDYDDPDADFVINKTQPGDK